MTRRPGSGIGGIDAARALRAARLALPSALPALAVSAAVIGGIDTAWAASDTTFDAPLDTVKDIVGGTGGQLAAALAVGAALVGLGIALQRHAADGRGRGRHRGRRRHRNRDRPRRHGDRLRTRP